MEKTLLFTQTIDGWLTRKESILLTLFAKHIPAEGEIVEIGSYKGKSTIHLAIGLKASRKKGYVWAVDPHKGVIDEHSPSQMTTEKEFLQNIKKAEVDTYIKPLVMTSQQAAKRWKKYIRLLFIDGLHDYTHVAEDIAYWTPFVVRGGVIAFHDGFCGHKGVEKAILAHIFCRKDIVDIGTASSILYVALGSPNWKNTLRVAWKKMLYKLAIGIHSVHAPWILQLIIIHRCIRILMLTPMTKKMYTQ